MSYAFDAHEGPILVRAEVQGPVDRYVLTLALDTGATHSLIGAGILVAIGYDPALAADRLQITTASGVEYVPYLAVAELSALGRHRRAFPVLAHTLPPSASVDGLLGLDFFRGQYLSIDFPRGRLTLR